MNPEGTVARETQDHSPGNNTLPRLLITLLGLVVIGEWLWLVIVTWELPSVSHLDGLAMQISAGAAMLLGRLALPVLAILGAIRYIQRRRDGIAAMLISGLVLLAPFLILPVFMLEEARFALVSLGLTGLCLAGPSIAAALLGYRYRSLFSRRRAGKGEDQRTAIEDT